MAKKSFLKKDKLKKAGMRALHAGERVAGAVGAGFLSKKVFGEKVNEKYHGLLLMGLGLVGETLVDNPHINSIAQGVTVMGGLKSVKTLLPDQAANLGLGDAEFTDFEELDGVDDDTPAEYRDDEPVAGLEEAAALLSGMGADVYTPEELELARQFD